MHLLLPRSRWAEREQDSADAYLNYDAEQGRFVIVPEVNGTKISDVDFQTYVRGVLDGLVAKKELPEVLEVDLDNSVYIKPNITSQQGDFGKSDEQSE